MYFQPTPGLPDATYIDTSGTEVRLSRSVPLAGYVDAAKVLLGDAAALGDAASPTRPRAIGNLARPFFPDGK